MIKLQQPCDHHYRGRTVWVNPAEIVSIDESERGEPSVLLGNGERIAVAENKDALAARVNEALYTQVMVPPTK
jgi:uncharacterized protein YlzI (FlbEa/FlbD family)